MARQRDPDRGYITWRPTAACTAKLDAVLQVLADYEEYLPVTLRQIFYILVARMVIAKTQNEYRKLAYIPAQGSPGEDRPVRVDP